MITNTALRVLSLEDSIPDFEIICDQLIKAGYNLDISHVETKSDFEISLRNNQYDIILVDFSLPGFDAFGALRLCNEICPNVPFICVSGSIGEETAIELLKLGAVDYVLKDRPERLPFAIKRALAQAKEKESRRQAEENLLRSEENFRRSISESPLGIRIVSVDGDTIYANKAFLDIYEFNSLEEFNSTPAINRYTPESYAQHQERKEKRKSGHDVVDYELSIVRKNGDIRHVKVWRKEILWNGVKHFQVINQDITEQKKLTEDLVAAKEHAEESDKLKSAFLANISHEIRTPMNGILGFAELLKSQELTPDEQEKYISIIEHSGNRMLNIINDIVDISKIEAGQVSLHIQETNVNQLLRDLYIFFEPEAQSKGLKLSFSADLPDEKSIIEADHTKLAQVMTNLIKNALKFTKSGSIEFGYVETNHALSLLTFFVKDTGVGISADQTSMIFERFRQGSMSLTRAYEGAGLGLSISKAFVEMMGGQIAVESEVGKGSVFNFQLPYSLKKQEETKVNDQADTTANLSPHCILIVEDEEPSRMYYTAILGNENTSILEASNGAEAVKAVKNHPEIDMVLMDIKMPEMDGYEATRQIRQFNNDIVIIAQTAFALSGDRENAIAAGCNDYISKPIRKAELMEVMYKYFGKQEIL